MMFRELLAQVENESIIRIADRAHAPLSAVSVIREKMQTLREYADAGLLNALAGTILRIEVRLQEMDLLHWLYLQNNPVKLYWADRDQEYIMAGIGETDVVSATGALSYDDIFSRLQARLARSHTHLRYYGGCRFYAPHPVDEHWQDFHTCRFIIPAFELFKNSDGTFLAANFLWEKDARFLQRLDQMVYELEHLNFSPTNGRKHQPQIIRRVDYPGREHWEQSIDAALQAFRSGVLEKIVLARKSVFECAEGLDPVWLLQRLRALNPGLFYFCFQFAGGRAFIGGSPERLYKRTSQLLKTEAVAGTRPRGSSPEEDFRFGKELITSSKDVREHRYVLESIGQALSAVCETVDTDDELSLLKLSRVQHLICRMQGILRPGIGDAELLQRLHPTPAVGGSPKEKAIAAIRELEPFDRGWYAGPVGYVGRASSEFAVAIRSGLITGRELALFSGAGIVEGSTSDGEWDEIENKIGNFMKILTEQ